MWQRNALKKYSPEWHPVIKPTQMNNVNPWDKLSHKQPTLWSIWRVQRKGVFYTSPLCHFPTKIPLWNCYGCYCRSQANCLGKMSHLTRWCHFYNPILYHSVSPPTIPLPMVHLYKVLPLVTGNYIIASYVWVWKARWNYYKHQQEA